MVYAANAKAVAKNLFWVNGLLMREADNFLTVILMVAYNRVLS